MGNKVVYDLAEIAALTGVNKAFQIPEAYVNRPLGSFGAIPPYFIPKGKVIIKTPEEGNEYDPARLKESFAATGMIHSVMPMEILRKDKTEGLKFPYDPFVTLSVKNVIVRRKVAKSGHPGTLKERWTQDDYNITIEGVFIHEEEDKYPQAYINELLELCNEKQEVEVKHELLLCFGIKYLVIEEVKFPHTTGVNNQSFVIKAWSDNPVELLVPL